MSEQGRTKARTGTALLVESLAVVASILVAFALDAWWDAQQQRADLVDSLASVAEEIEANAASLELEERFHRTAVSSIDDLVARIDAADGARWLTMPDTIASFAFVFPPVFDASTGALEAVVSSGALSRVEEPRLERALGDLGALIVDVQDGEMGARSLAFDELVPLFWEAPDLAYAMGRGPDYRRRGMADVALESREIRLPNVPGLRNRLVHRRAWITSSLRAIEDLQSSFDEALELLRVETAG